MRNTKRRSFAAGAVLLLLGLVCLAKGGRMAFAEEEICTITIENVTRGEDYPDTEAVEEAANAITVPAIGCRVKIVNCPIQDHAARVAAMAGGRGQIDLICTGLTTSLSELAADGAVIPLDELLEEYGPNLRFKARKLFAATTIHGRIYAVPGNLYTSKAMGIGYNQTIARECGLTLYEGMTMEDLAGLGETLKEKGIYLTSQGDGNLTAFPAYYDLEAFGGDLNYGVIYDPLESTEIVNAYESEQYREYCETLRSWRQLGYLPDDTIFGGENGETLFYEGKAFYQWSSVSPGTERIIQAKRLTFPQVLLPLTENELSTESVLENAWGITAGCENPQKAMELLNLLYVHGELANLLQNGLEDREYQRVSENVIRYADGTDSASLGYGTSFTTFGDGCQIAYFEPADEDFHQRLRAFNREAKVSLTMGYLFDTEGLASEIAAVSSVAAEYRPILETGMADDVEELLERFNKALQEAGIDRIIEENKAQLAQWLRNES